MNSLVTKVGGAVTRRLGGLSLMLKARSPEILIGAGIGLVIGGTVLACKATNKARDIMADRREEIWDINEAEKFNLESNGYDVADKSKDDDYAKDTRKQAKTERLLANVRCGWGLVKCYAPSVALEAAGIACFLGAHGIMRRRNSALIAAYEATEAAYRRLQERQRQDGKDEERAAAAKARVESGNGDVLDELDSGTSGRKYNPDEQFNQYSFFFDEMCDAWKGDAEMNLTFVRMVENVLTKRLQARGFVFLNEVREMFGMDSPGPIAQGQIIGWMTKLGDTCVDLGLKNGYQEGVRSFVNGRDRSVLLTPNCHHVIYDKL